MAAARAQLIPVGEPLPDPKRLDGRDSMNLIEFPLSVLSDRVPAGMAMLEFQDEIRDPQTGEMVTRKLMVDGAGRYGLPTTLDDEVILGLIQLTKLRNNFTDRKVHFSRYELMHLLGWPNSGQTYKRIEEALDRWMRVTLDYQRAWWDKARKSWVDVKFHIIDQVFLYERESKKKKTGQGSAREKPDDQPTLPFSHFVWNEVVFNSFQDGYLKQLNLDLYLRLRLPIARRMYRFLDKRFYRRDRLEFDLPTFAFEHIGLSRTYHTGKIKEKLAPAIAELEAIDYLKPMKPADRYLKQSRGKWKVVFVHKPEPPVQPLAIVPSLVRELTLRGVTESVAKSLVDDHPAEAIWPKLDVFDWMIETNDRNLARNPAGYLVQSIRDGYAAPKAYEPREVREAKRQAAAEAKRQREEVNLKRAQAEQAKADRDAAERRARAEHVKRYLDSLSATARTAFIDQAIATASPSYRDYITKGAGAMAEAARTMVIEAAVMAVAPMAAMAGKGTEPKKGKGTPRLF